jgi:hypothetical protein
MHNPFDMHRVVWNDGDVLTAGHFKELEVSIDNQRALGFVLAGYSGLVRDPDQQSGYNRADCITVKHGEGQNYKVTVDRVQGITPDGKIVQLNQRRTFDLSFRMTSANEDEYYYLYLVPQEEGEADVESDMEPVSGVVRFTPSSRISLSDETGTGLQIARLVLVDSVLSVDRSYIPYALFPASCDQSRNAIEDVRSSVGSVVTLLDSYISAFVPAAELAGILNVSLSLFRAASSVHALIMNTTLLTREVFNALIVFFCHVRVDALALSRILTSQSDTEKALGFAREIDPERLSAMIEKRDLTGAFVITSKWISGLISLLASLPSGPVIERSLRIRNVDFVRGSGFGNRLTITLDEPASLRRGASHATISLRDISLAEPKINNVRIGFDNSVYPQLLDLPGILKRQGNDTFTYRIDLPKEVIDKEQANTITLYLPQPFGEDIPDLKSRISVFIKE